MGYVRAVPGTDKWEVHTVYEFTAKVTWLVSGIAWQIKRDHGRWNKNHVFSEVMASCGLMTEKSPEASLIGSTALAVLEALTENN